MACANDQYFSDPKLRAEHERFARGFDPREGTFQGRITFPQEDKVYRRDRLLFRFGHGGKSDEENLSSPWWLREASFNEIVARARMSERNLIEMSRIKNAVPHRFGPADVIYTVEILDSLRVFTGRGRPVVEESSTPDSTAKRIFPGGFEVAQLYIPGLREGAVARCRSKMWFRALKKYRSEPTLEYVVNQAARNAAGLRR